MCLLTFAAATGVWASARLPRRYRDTRLCVFPAKIPEVLLACGMRQAFARVAREGTDYEFEFRIVRPDGMVRYIHSVGHPLINESSELTELIGTVMDVTERKHAEEALQKAQAELAHATRVSTLGELTTSIAHEVNQPLSAIVIDGQCLRALARARSTGSA